MSELLDKITWAVERTSGCPVSHRESSPVVETFRGQTIWEGVVEVFDVTTPPPATAYGWAVEDASGPQYVAVLGTPPVDSPLAAVRAWLVSQTKKQSQ
jgi:hypothetical protein